MTATDIHGPYADYCLRSPKAMRIIETFYTKMMPEFSESDFDIYEKVLGEVVDEMVHVHDRFHYLQLKQKYFNGLMQQAGLSWKPEDINFGGPMVGVPLKKVDVGVHREIFATLFHEIDMTYLSIEACRLMNVIEIADYHQQVRSLDGSLYSGLRRIVRDFTSRWIATLETVQQKSAQPNM